MDDTVLRRWFYILAILALLTFLIQSLPFAVERVLVVLFTASLLAAAVAPAATYFQRFKVPRWLTILLIYLMGILVLVEAVTLVVPLVTGEVDLLRNQLPGYVQQLQDALAKTDLAPTDIISLNDVVNRLSAELGSIVGGVTNFVRDLLGIGLTVLIVLVIAFFMAVEEGFVLHLISRFVPPARRERTIAILQKIGQRLGAWVRAQALLALFFGITFGLGLWVLRVPYAATLGVVGAILEIIPYIGGATTLLLAMLVALTKGPLLVLFTVLWYTVVVQVQGHVMAPLLLGRPLGLHPLVVVLALFLGIETIGPFGALLAVPIAIIVQVLIDEFYVFKEDVAADHGDQYSEEHEPAQDLTA
jgi:predicted PurR-regulated permease PerM